LKPNQKYF